MRGPEEGVREEEEEEQKDEQEVEEEEEAGEREREKWGGGGSLECRHLADRTTHVVLGVLNPRIAAVCMLYM